MTNILTADEYDAAAEICTVLHEDACVRIEKIVSYGHRTPPEGEYCQKEDEWVSVLLGQGTVCFTESGAVHTLSPGEHLWIPAGVRHRVTHTTKPCVWLCVFSKKGGCDAGL